MRLQEKTLKIENENQSRVLEDETKLSYKRQKSPSCPGDEKVQFHVFVSLIHVLLLTLFSGYHQGAV